MDQRPKTRARQVGALIGAVMLLGVGSACGSAADETNTSAVGTAPSAASTTWAPPNSHGVASYCPDAKTIDAQWNQVDVGYPVFVWLSYYQPPTPLWRHYPAGRLAHLTMADWSPQSPGPTDDFVQIADPQGVFPRAPELDVHGTLMVAHVDEVNMAMVASAAGSQIDVLFELNQSLSSQGIDYPITAKFFEITPTGTVRPLGQCSQAAKGLSEAANGPEILDLIEAGNIDGARQALVSFWSASNPPVPVSVPFAQEDPDRRALADAPVELLAQLRRAELQIDLPDAWTGLPLYWCTKIDGVGWNPCIDLAQPQARRPDGKVYMPILYQPGVNLDLSFTQPAGAHISPEMTRLGAVAGPSLIDVPGGLTIEVTTSAAATAAKGADQLVALSAQGPVMTGVVTPALTR